MKRYRSGMVKNESRSNYTPRKASNLSMRVAALESATEWKSKDFYSPTNTWLSNGVVTQIFELAEGAGSDERVGRKVKIKSIQLHFTVINRLRTATASVTTELRPVRTMLVYDKQSNAGTPSYSDILQDDNLGTGDEALAFRNLNNKERFIILYDNFDATDAGDGLKQSSCRYQFVASTDTYTDEAISGKVYRKLNMEAIFGVTDAPITGALYVVTCGGGTPGETDPDGKWVTRVRYVDE